MWILYKLPEKGNLNLMMLSLWELQDYPQITNTKHAARLVTSLPSVCYPDLVSGPTLFYLLY